jgi:uncharacterized protein
MVTSRRRTEVVKLLLEKGADVNIKANDGTAALIMASENRYTEIVKLLLAAKADVNVKVSTLGKDFTPLSTAKQNGIKEINELLEKAGAKE